MKNNIMIRIVGFAFALLAVMSAVCAATVTGGGFLDLSNIARAAFTASAIVCAGLAFVLLKKHR